MSTLFGLSLLLIFNLVNAVDPTLKLDPFTISVPIKSGGDNFNLRYFANTEFSTTSKGTILLHLTFGNDADVVGNQQKYIFSIAQQLNASLYVAEHRYFGASKPVAGVTSYPDVDTVADIGIDLALADFKQLVKTLRNDSQKVIVSGAGYAGEIATILRMQDTDKLIFGSIISNAPLRLHQGGGLGLGDFDKQLNAIYEKEGCAMDKIKDALTTINTATTTNQKEIADALKLTTDGTTILDNLNILQNYLHRAYVGLVDQNLDVKSTLGTAQNFDPRPVKKYCDQVKALPAATTPAEKVKPIQLLIEAYYQDSDKVDSVHDYVALPTDARFNYIPCSSNIFYHCSLGDNVNDYFLKRCSSDTDWTEPLKTDCKKLMPKFSSNTMMKTTKISDLTSTFKFTDLTNIIYIEGEYDPNQVGSVNTVDATKNQYKFLIPGVTKLAHLVPPTSCDPDNVKQLRYRVINILKCWINDDTTNKCASSEFTGDLPVYVATTGTCTDELLAYPWNQSPGTAGTGATSKPGGGKGDTTTHSASMQLFVQIPVLALGALILLL